MASLYENLYSTPSYTSYPVSSGSDFAAVWVVISAILAVVGGILVYALFLSKKNGAKVKGFWKWLYEFLKFDKLSIELILKLTYVIAAIYLSLVSLTFLGTPAWYMFFAVLIGGNLGLRITYELVLITVLLWRNTEDIKKSLKK
jgi:hypothetical protein